MRETIIPELIGEAVERVLAGTPTVVSIEGEAGFGKSHLLRAIRRSLSGFTILRAYGEREEPDVGGRLLSELLGANSSLELGNTLHAVRVLLQYFDARQAGGPVCLLVDDLQWADAESVRALAGAARRLDGDRLLIIAAGRPLRKAHPEWRRMLADLDARRVRLDGLDLDAVSKLVHGFDTAAPAALIAQLRDHTAGNPLYLTALLREHSMDELATMAATDDLPAPLQLASHMEERLSRLSSDAAALLAALAVLGDSWVPVEIAEAVAGVSSDVARDLLVEEGLAQARGGRDLPELRISHSMMRAAVYRVIPSGQRSNLHRRSADAVLDKGARLRHQLAANGTRTDRELGSELIAYANAQHDLGHYRNAGLFLRLAARATESAEDRRVLLLDADVEALLGRDPSVARTHLIDGDARDRLVVAMSFANRSEWLSAWSTLAPVGAEELGHLPERKAFQFLALRAWSAAGCGRPAESILADVAVADSLQADRSTYGLLEFGRAQALTQSSDEESIWRWSAHGVDRELLTADAAGSTALAWRGIVYSMNGLFAEAIADLTLATELIGEGALDFNDGNMHALLGFSYFAVGDLPRATLNLDVLRATGEEIVHPISLACSSIRRVLGGEDMDSRAASEAARSRLIRERFAGGTYVADIVDVVLLALDGTEAERQSWARRRWIELGDPATLAATYTQTPALWSFAVGLAQAWIGNPRAADEYADDLQARAIVPPFRDDLVEWLRTRAAAGRGEDVASRYAALVDAAFRDVPMLRTMLVNDATTAMGSTIRHAGTEPSGSSPPASGWPVKGLPGGTDLDHTADMESPLGALTERERAVAALVVDGMSYTQIAKELFVTRSTVAFHLSNCYAKTGTTSRHELAQLVRSFRAPTFAQLAS